MRYLFPMKEQFPRSPYDSIRGLVYFPRMLDKIRIHAAGKLPEVYHEHLGDASMAAACGCSASRMRM